MKQPCSLRVGFNLCLFVLWTLNVHAQEPIDCDIVNNTCASENKKCIADESVDACGDCINGYIMFRNECVAAEALNLDDYIDEFQPLWTFNISQSERRELLLETALFISEHNVQESEYSLGLNKFSADTTDEALQRTGYLHVEGSEDRLPQEPLVPEDSVPPSIDWVNAGAVTAVKDQGRCGSCWAISMAGAIEGAAAIGSNFTYRQSLSFQQFISCNDENSGCAGGNTVTANVYAAKNDFGGLATLTDYPYTDNGGTTTEECKLDELNASLAVTTSLGKVVETFQTDDVFDERLMRMKSAVSRQPVSVVIKSNCQTLSSYKSGILTDDGDCSCNEIACIDHAILLVGYNDEADTAHWVLKNSWGTDWGEDGYFRIAQKNPTGNELSWGLFGMLGQGVVAFEATNETSVEPEGGGDGGLSGETIFAIVITACCGFCIFLGCVPLCYGYWCKKKFW